MMPEISYSFETAFKDSLFKNHRIQVGSKVLLSSHWDICIKPSQFSGVEVDRRRHCPSPWEISESNTYINALNVLTVFSSGMEK